MRSEYKATIVKNVAKCPQFQANDMELTSLRKTVIEDNYRTQSGNDAISAHA